MSTISPQRPDWHAVLERIEETLARAIREAEAHAKSAPTPAKGETLSVELPAPNSRLDELAARTQAALADLDRELQAHEEAMRVRLSSLADTRQKLANWTARAIG